MRTKLALMNRSFVWANVREAQELNRLRYREKKLFTRLRRIEQDIKQAMTRNVVVTSPQLRHLQRSAVALTTYIAMPVSLPREQQRIIASLQDTYDV